MKKCMAVGGFAAGAVQTGTLRGALAGSVSATIFYGVGSAFTSQSAPWAYSGKTMKFSGYAAKTLTHGIAGGVMSTLQGGNFGHGFASAGFGEAMSPTLAGIESVPAQAIATAVVGGTASVLAGGKFANGAVTAAFGYAFGAAASRGMATGSGNGPAGLVSVPDEIVVGESGFPTPGAAAKAFGGRYYQQGVDERAEYQTGIVRLDKDNFGYIVPGAGPAGATIVDPAPLFNAIRGAGFKMVGWAHTHFDNNLWFSGTDMQFVKDNDATMFMTNRNNETYQLTPDMLRRAASGYRGTNRIDQFINGTRNFQGQRVP